MSLLRPAKSHGLTSGRQPGARSDQSAAVTNLESNIASFQAILTDDDRKKLQSLKTTAHDAQSIIMFTAELDQVDFKRRGKSVASRLASFLQTIEQFSPVVDTYVQSNPGIAALIWGSVKLTFKILANVTSYFESFVEQLHGFGSFCSRFAEYRVIFADSLRLKNSICEFHSAVINCCKRIVLEVPRPGRPKAWKMPTVSFQSQIRSYVDDIKSKAENVREDIQLAKAQADQAEQRLQAEERQEASGNRKQLSSWFSKSMEKMKAISEHAERVTLEEQRHRLLKDLSSFDFTAAFRNISTRRHCRTVGWVFDTDEFQSWFKSQESGVLHITGKIGSGKSVVTSSVVQRLCQERNSQQFVSFFFSQFDNLPSLNSETIIRSVVQQLLSSSLVDSLDAAFARDLGASLRSAKSEYFSKDSLEKLYAVASVACTKWFIVLDGVDECERDEQTFLFQFFSRLLRNLPQSQTIKLLITGRITTIDPVDQSFGTTWRLITGSAHTSADIVTYAEDVIGVKLSTQELVVRDPEVIKEILQTIAAKEEGMGRIGVNKMRFTRFLWAFLTIEDICSKKTDADIRKTLQEIPTDLPATFNRALGRIVQRRNETIAKDIFSWTAAVRQPLTLSQLQEALSIKVGQRTLNPEDLISGMNRVTAWCENLVCVEETDCTVHFSHHSIREFLLSPDMGEHRNFHSDINGCDLRIGEICVTYLNLENFRTAVTESHQKEASVALDINMGQLAKQTVHTAVKGSMRSRMGDLASRVVRSTSHHSDSKAQGTTMSIEAPVLSTPSPLDNMDFLFFETEENTWKLLGRILRSPHHAINLPWMDQSERMSLLQSLRSSSPPWTYYLTSMLATTLLRPDEDLGPLHDLIYAIMYASQKGNWALACWYSAEADPCFRAFVVVTMGSMGALTFSTLCRELELEPSALFHARTSTHKSIIDLAAGRKFSDDAIFIASFFEYFRTEVPNPSQWNTQSLAISGLCSALRNGACRLAEVLLEECLLTGGDDPLCEEDTMAILSDTIKCFWPLKMSKKIVTAFFGETAEPPFTSYRKILFEKCVMSNNWNFATALADMEPSLGAHYESDKWFHFLTETLVCEKCRERSQAYIQGAQNLQLSKHIYAMCSWHTEKAQTIDRNPRTELDIIKGTLQWDVAELN
ncbi:hypothetical protein FDECE_9232 [Fusarium decemcellulare]|nr:hypothetical protein FDECE_9232 [Fusarium decemcellulare]